MKLSFVFSQLQGSELAQLSLVDPETGQIKSEKYRKIVDAINLGLIDLYGRFLLKIGTVTVPIEADAEVYNLALVDKKVPAKMIQIHRVIDQDGREIPYNDFSVAHSVHFTEKTVMHVPKHLRQCHNLTSITVQYKSMPKQTDPCDDYIDPDFMEVDIDYQYVKALCYFVGSRMHAPVGLQDATYQPNAFFSMYNAECQRLEDENFELSYVATPDRLRANGWA